MALIEKTSSELEDMLSKAAECAVTVIKIPPDDWTAKAIVAPWQAFKFQSRVDRLVEKLKLEFTLKNSDR